MDDDRLDQIPEPYQAALRLLREGKDESGIATALGLEPQAVRALLELAEAKLASQRRYELVRSGGRYRVLRLAESTTPRNARTEALNR